ncbi:uncharacterized protein FSUBG_12346 [Fusarium subglutinans]|uniref:Uncharacterized protein n=1 Tax=Gibberella subglutinans TaxID=42677 RepID=A0A8H5P0W1_GIBSU|nr:uncharacterized protein FSUBG_12346 [Fusarium subglutinans]KAF5585757.1 hypothetical protein FSUBG_12346 [Fusarium subglutinans]
MPFKRFKNEKEKKRARQALIRQKTARLQYTMDAIHSSPFLSMVPQVECIEYQTPYGTIVDMKDFSIEPQQHRFMATTNNGMWCKTSSIDDVNEMIRLVQREHGNIEFCIRLDRCNKAKLNKAKDYGCLARRTVNQEY